MKKLTVYEVSFGKEVGFAYINHRIKMQVFLNIKYIQLDHTITMIFYRDGQNPQISR